MVPETKGRSFAELDELFARKIAAWNFAKTEVSVGNRQSEEQLRGEA